MPIANYFSIDVEDYFQVSAFEEVSPRCTWSERELRVERNTEKVLAILDETGIKGTFFVLGWVAEHCPGLVRRIAAERHEIACHGYSHRRVCQQSREEFREDIKRSKSVIEDQAGAAVLGYRAPSYSISPRCYWAFDELLATGFRYDSSIFPVHHDFYGMPQWQRFRGLAMRDPSGAWQPAGRDDRKSPILVEMPITPLNLLGVNLPIAGGGYFRLFPYSFTRWGLQRINRGDGRPFVFYLHPWELDPDQPRMAGAGMKSRFRHYLNLGKTERRLRRLLDDFSFVPLCNSLRRSIRPAQAYQWPLVEHDGYSLG